MVRKVLLVAVASSAVLLTAVAGAAQGASAKVAVSQGISSALLAQSRNGGGQPVFPIDSDTPPNTPEQVSFILKTQNESQLENQATNAQGHYLSVDQFARQYGQSRQNVSLLQSYLAHYGIHTTVMADNLDVQATGTAGEFDKALSVSQRDYEKPAVPARHGHPGAPAFHFHGAQGNPLLPKQLASFVLAILGLTDYPTYQNDAVRAPQYTSADSSTVQLGDRLPSDFSSDYHLPSGSGAGSTIGIVTLAALDEPSATTFWSTLPGVNSSSSRIDVVNVDGGPGGVSDAAGSGETTLDVEQSGAIAGQANVIVYQAPNTDPGFLDAFFQAASDNKADDVSASWGEAEDVISYSVKNGLESPAYEQTFDEAFLEMAVQGQSAFVSSGDAGAYDDSDELGTTDLNVDSPGDSPWVVSSGGTTLAGTIPLPNDDSVTIAAERAWGWDYLFPKYADFCFLFADPSDCTETNWAKIYASAGDGGGYSADESMPQYQRQVGAQRYSAVQYFTPTAFDSTDFAPLTLPTDWNVNFTPRVQTGNGNGRGEPDLSADADPETGYQEYFSFDNCPNAPGACTEDGWGGTSFVAPQLNGANAVIVANLHHRVGFWNPQVYSFAGQHGSPFHVLDSASANNDNLFYTGTPGQLWNPATGLGTPDLAALQGDFAHGGH